MSPEIEVVYARHPATIWASAFIAGGKTGPFGPLAIASAVIDFGDGTTASVGQPCAAPPARLKLQHVYPSPGDYTLSVSSAVLCQPGGDLVLDDGEGIRALAAAPSASANWPACTTYQLRVTGAWTGAGLGNVASLIRLSNVSNAGCNLKGYPDLELVSADGSLLPAHVQHATGGAYLFPSIAVGRVALSRGDVAAFEVAYTDVPPGSAATEPYDVACPAARWVRVTLPETRQFGIAKYPMAPCDGAMSVSPIFPGADRIDFPGA